MPFQRKSDPSRPVFASGRGGTLRRRFPDDRHGLGVLIGVADNGTARLDDAAFFGGNGGVGLPQQAGMVEVDMGQNRADGRLDDVGGVETAAQADLQHDIVAPLLPEPEKGDRRHQFKLGHDGALPVQPLHQRLQPLDQRSKGGPGDHATVDLVPFPEVHHEGRGIQAGLIPGGGQHFAEHGADGALAVGAGHMEKAHPPLGRTAERGDAPDTREAGARAKRQPGMHKLHSLGVGHKAKSPPE